MPKYKNNPDQFSRLNLDALTKHARMWALKIPLKFSFEIQRIVLYQNLDESTPYLLCFEVRQDDLIRAMSALHGDGLLDLAGDQFFLEVYRPPFQEGDRRWDWMTYVVEPGEQIIEIEPESCWILFEQRGATKKRSVSTMRWERFLWKAEQLTKDNEEITHEDIANDPTILLIWPKSKVPSEKTLVRKLQGNVPTKRGRRAAGKD